MHVLTHKALVKLITTGILKLVVVKKGIYSHFNILSPYFQHVPHYNCVVSGCKMGENGWLVPTVGMVWGTKPQNEVGHVTKNL
jgi:hypothetical protein